MKNESPGTRGNFVLFYTELSTHKKREEGTFLKAEIQEAFLLTRKGWQLAYNNGMCTIYFVHELYTSFRGGGSRHLGFIHGWESQNSKNHNSEIGMVGISTQRHCLTL